MFDYITQFLNQPFRSNGTAGDWFLFVGLLLVILWLWAAVARDWKLVANA
jgi:hypothetical protein